MSTETNTATRREWWLAESKGNARVAIQLGGEMPTRLLMETTKGVHVREVLPGDDAASAARDVSAASCRATTDAESLDKRLREALQEIADVPCFECGIHEYAAAALKVQRQGDAE